MAGSAAAAGPAADTVEAVLIAGVILLSSA